MKEMEAQDKHFQRYGSVRVTLDHVPGTTRVKSHGDRSFEIVFEGVLQHVQREKIESETRNKHTA